MNMESVKKGVKDLTASKKEAMCRNIQLKDELKKMKLQKCEMKQLHADLCREVEELERELGSKMHAKDKQNEELACKDKMIQELDEKIKSLNANNCELEACIENLKSELEQNKGTVADLGQKIEGVKKQIADNECEIEELKRQNAELKECECRLKEEQRSVNNTLNMIAQNMKQVEEEMEKLTCKLQKSEKEKKRLEVDIEQMEVCLCTTEDKIKGEMKAYEALKKQNKQLACELAELEEKIAVDQEKIGKYECALQKMKTEEDDQVRKLQHCISRAETPADASCTTSPMHRHSNKSGKRVVSVPMKSSSCDMRIPKKKKAHCMCVEDEHRVRFRSAEVKVKRKQRKAGCQHRQEH